MTDAAYYPMGTVQQAFDALRRHSGEDIPAASGKVDVPESLKKNSEKILKAAREAGEPPEVLKILGEVLQSHGVEIELEIGAAASEIKCYQKEEVIIMEIDVETNVTEDPGVALLKTLVLEPMPHPKDREFSVQNYGPMALSRLVIHAKDLPIIKRMDAAVKANEPLYILIDGHHVPSAPAPLSGLYQLSVSYGEEGAAKMEQAAEKIGLTKGDWPDLVKNSPQEPGLAFFIQTISCAEGTRRSGMSSFALNWPKE